ncbi:MAG: plasma-membrane proton-efflux P-type ATPase [Candidatus Bathyarchaeia archaeon]
MGKWRAKGETATERKEIIDFHKMKAEDVIKLLKSDLNLGLKGAEVESRLKQYGYNEVPEKKTNPVARFAKKFWGITAWMLEIIIILSWILQRYSDLYIVTALLFLNSIIGFVQEQKASSAVEVLKKKLQVNARVLRDGTWKIVPARELVPGDVVRVRSGDFVPADVKIIMGELEVDQSALTGESMEVEKKSDDILYSGSIVKRGEANGLVILTGIETYFGRTAQLVQIARPKLHMEEVVSKVVKWLLVIVVTLLGVAFVFSIVKGINPLEILPLMLVLLLGAIPVALPAMFTVSMAIGSMELVKRGVLVTRLSASEDAATMDILCVDKTGTITMNKLSIANVIPWNEYSEQEVILYGALASQEANQDPIDLAFITMAKQKNLMNNSFVQKNFTPFDSKTRRTEALVLKDNKEFGVMKGAVNVVALACRLDERAIRELEAKMNEFAIKGYRTLAVAKTEERQNQPKLVGLVTLYDMPRPDSKQLIQELKDLGISVKMLTGDALPIAKEIAKEVGLGENVVKMSDLKELVEENPTKAVEVAEESDGFAEIYPEDKYTIVKNLQAKGHIVGMTGDGVNDAPALRQAEVGIAVSNATDVAKGAASVVLTNEGLSNIVDLIKNGRTIFERINTWILNKITRTILKTSFIVLAFLFIGKYIMSASAMLLMMFMTDFVKISLSTDNVRWSRRPDIWNISGLVKVAVILGLIMVAETFGLLYIGFKYFNLMGDDQILITFSFETLFYFAIFSIFVVRERRHFWDSVPSKTLFTTIMLDVIIATAISVVGIPGLKAIPLIETLCIMVYSCIFSLIINDLIKFILVKKTGIGW